MNEGERLGNYNTLHKTFLQVVRLGVGTSKDARLSDDIDWVQLKALADVQGLSAVVLDGLCNDNGCVNLDLDILKVLRLQWIGEVMQNYEKRYVEYEKAIGSLAGWYNAHGYKMMVLKGYACSINWPKPEHRPCGDIDIWLFGRQRDADVILELEEGIKIDKAHHHHTVFYWRDFMVENHYDFLNTFSNRTSSQLEPILKELAMDDTNSVEVNGEKVYLPSANLNALFLLRHMLMHFVACGINLRMILDWAFFWEKEGKKVDKRWLKEIVDRYHMSAFFNIINAICVHDLGFDASVFPSIQCDPELKEKVLNDTLCPEYDWRDAHQRNLIKRILFKYRRWRSGAWKRELCYGESHWVSFWTSVWSHLLKPASI